MQTSWSATIKSGTIPAIASDISGSGGPCAKPTRVEVWPTDIEHDFDMPVQPGGDVGEDEADGAEVDEAAVRAVASAGQVGERSPGSTAFDDEVVTEHEQDEPVVA